jgi:ribosomal protein S18 acetylase RimI-like enzyme
MVRYMKPIRVRPMTSEDIPVIVDWVATIPLWQRYQLTAERAYAQFERALARKEWLVVADLGQEDGICGFAWCLGNGAFGRSAYLRLIGVHPDYSGAGIGVTLLEQTEQFALTVGDDLFLLVSDFNIDAQHFYQRQGYDQIGAIPGYVLPDVTELIYKKRLC